MLTAKRLLYVDLCELRADLLGQMSGGAIDPPGLAAKPAVCKVGASPRTGSKQAVDNGDLAGLAVQARMLRRGRGLWPLAGSDCGMVAKPRGESPTLQSAVTGAADRL